MTPASLLQQTHLSEDQLDHHLVGDLAPAAAGHLASCAHCKQRVAEAAAPLASFRAVSLAWSERQSAAAAIPVPAAAGTEWHRRLAWSLALIVCGVGLGAANSLHHAVTFDFAAAPSQVADSQPAPPPSADQLSSDNQLLGTIDNEIHAPHENSATLGLLPLGLKSVNAPRMGAVNATLVRASVQD